MYEYMYMYLYVYIHRYQYVNPITHVDIILLNSMRHQGLCFFYPEAVAGQRIPLPVSR